jgi:DNA replication protein DnaC
MENLIQTPSIPVPESKSDVSGNRFKSREVAQLRHEADVALIRLRAKSGGSGAGKNEFERAVVGAVVLQLSAEETERQERLADRQSHYRAVENWKNSGVPEKFRSILCDPLWESLPESIDGKAVRSAYQEVYYSLLNLESSCGIIVALVGDRGNGKTYMGCMMVKRACRYGHSAMYREAMDYFMDLRATYGNAGRGTELEVESRYRRPSLLVLDAVEEKASNEFEQRMLTRLLNKRLNDNKLTLIISNDTAQSLPSRIGRSLTDRLNDGGGILVCGWPSLRGKIQP